MKKRTIGLLLAVVCLAALASLPIRAAAAEPVLSITLDQSSVPADGMLTGTWQITGMPENYAHVHLDYIYTRHNADGSTFSFVRTDEGVDTSQDTGGPFAIRPRGGVKGQLKFLVHITTNPRTGAGHDLEAVTPYFNVTSPQNNNPITCTFTLDKTTVKVGEAIKASYKLTGDTSKYDLRVWMNGTWGETTEAPGHITFVPAAGNSGAFNVALDHKETDESLHFSSEWFEITGASGYLEGQLEFGAASMAVGVPMEMTWTAQGGVAPYTAKQAQIELYENNRFLQSVLIDKPASTFTYTPSFGDRAAVRVHFQDANGHESSVRGTIGITGYAANPPTCVITSSGAEFKPGEDVTFTWQVTGGKTPYQSIKGKPDIWSMNDETLDASGSKTYTIPANYSSPVHFGVKVTDTDGRVYAFRSEPVLMTTRKFNVSLDRSTVKAGETIRVQVAPADSTDATEYQYSISCNFHGSSDTTFSGTKSGPFSADYTPYLQGAGIIRIDVRENNATSPPILSRELPITVAGDVNPINLNLKVDTATLALGGTATASWDIQGGNGPYVEDCHWTVVDSRISQVASYQDLDEAPLKGSFATTPVMGTQATIYLQVRDQDGRKQVESRTVTITGAPRYEKMNLSLALDRTRVEEGGTITASWEVSGGVKPYTYQCEWVIYDKDQYYGAISQKPDTSTTSLKVPTGVSGQLFIEVWDAAGIVVASYSPRFNILSDIKGDADGDGQVTFQDLLVTVNHMVNNSPIKRLGNVDLNNDGTVSPEELVALISILIGN